MRSDPTARYSLRLEREASHLLRGEERCVALLPFTSVPRRARHGGPKILTGLHQTARRYRPLVVTSERLLVFDSGRTPGPRGLLAAYPLRELRVLDVAPLRFGGTRFVLEVEGDAVPFDAGRHDVGGLEVLFRLLDAGSGAGDPAAREPGARSRS